MPVVFYSLMSFTVIWLMMNASEQSIGSLFYALVACFSLLAFAIVYQIEPNRAYRVVLISTLIVGYVAIAQFVFGINNVSVPGLTYTYGQDLSTKPIGYLGGNAGDNAAKMVSTYHNGNLYGLFLLLAFPYIMQRKERGHWEIIRLLAMVGCVAGVALCGSRSVVIPFTLVALPILTLWVKQATGKYNGKTRLIFCIMIISIIFVFCMTNFNSVWFQQIWNRLVGLTLSDMSMTGRTDQWSSVLSDIISLSPQQLVEWVFFGGLQSSSEGLLGMFALEGPIIAVTFIASCLVCIAYLAKCGLISGAFSLFGVLIAFAVDLSFYYPPSVMLFFSFVALWIRQRDGLKEFRYQ